MAQRFGGKYSPDAPAPDANAGAANTTPATAEPVRNAFDGQRPTKAGFRSNLLFVLPFLFLWSAFRGDPTALIFGLAAFGLLMLAAWLTREGLFAQEAYDARRVARRPAFPRKIAGSLLTGAGLGLGCLMADQGVLLSGLLGIIGAGLHFAAFGADPLTDKGAEGIDQFQTDRVARAVVEAERTITAMRDAILRAGDRQLAARVDRFAQTARQMFRTVESDPRDLTAARKYLGVYLQGARDATVKFADLYTRSHDPKARADYDALLTDLEANFARQTQKFLSNDRTDLDVEIEVLRERLQQDNRH